MKTGGPVLDTSRPDKYIGYLKRKKCAQNQTKTTTSASVPKVDARADGSLANLKSSPSKNKRLLGFVSQECNFES
jgi:hypothetical protein